MSDLDRDVPSTASIVEAEQVRRTSVPFEPPKESRGDSSWKSLAFEMLQAEAAETAAAFFDVNFRLLAQNPQCSALLTAQDASSLGDLFGSEAPAIRTIAAEALQGLGELERDFTLAREPPCRVRMRVKALHSESGAAGVALLMRTLGPEEGGLEAPGGVDARLRNVIDALPTMTFLLDADGVLREANAAALMATGLSPADAIGRPLCETYWWSADANAQQRLLHALEVAKTGKVDRYQEKMRVGAERHITVMLHIASLGEASNDHTCFVVSATDVSNLVELQERQTLLAGELTHRAKNILAIVKSLVSRAARRARSKEALVRSLEGRINAMASAISQLSRSQWVDYDLKEIICEQLEASDRERIAISGPALQISPRAAMAFALVIYELASNALKHGSLRDSDGKLAITWSIEAQSLHFSWRERCASPIADAGDAGFGSTLIRNLVESDLGATLNIDYRSHGIELQFEAPLSQLGREAEENSGSKGDWSSQDGVKGKRVLVMESSPVIGLDLANMLETAGAIVFGPFTTIDDARASLQQNRVDIAFLDVEARKDCVFSLARLAEKRGAALVLAAMEDNAAAVRKTLPGAVVVSKPFSEIDAMQALAATI